jgi:glycosyltransferase involved in cell wall biosynthesis
MIKRKKKPLISVLVTTYNHEKYIGRCLRSLLDQTLNKDLYEIVVVDDCSVDKTSYGLDLFHDSIVRIINKKNIGLSKSLNKAIKRARGKYIVRVDSDDYVNSNFLNILLLFLELNVHYDAISCDYYLVDEFEEIINKYNCIKDPIACGILFRKQQLIEIGMYDPIFFCNEEREMRIRFEKKYKIGRVELPLYRYRRHASNITNNQVNMKSSMEKLMIKHKLNV